MLTIDLDRIAALTEATFDARVHVLARTVTARPTGGHVTTFGDVARTLRGRCRPVGEGAGASRWVVLVPRLSGIGEGDRLLVENETGDRRWVHTFDVVAVRAPKSAHVVDRLVCAPIRLFVEAGA